ncbi:hypothetical protein F7734_53820 [Scytonema sp. UIC 10036]|uniref:hypothetical protein n=1 Tax=Scytonema sp. UIC 10036 TaxID=2304196 RepID=UPI0012DA5921|nr:hypothetical protein [Scytonema sp. UIC 10036]MUH00688.1 hypothetical protein [Scytonema sp. UIC 10036]
MAHIITSDREAIEIAKQIAGEFVQVPKKSGDAYVSNVTLAGVIKLLSEGDGSIGQW